MDIVIVGGANETNVARSLHDAAQKIGMSALLVDHKEAYGESKHLRRLFWHCAGRRPPFIGRFSERVAQLCKTHRPRFVLTTGLCPVNRDSLHEIRQYGATTLNFMTDDPWNPVHRAAWFEHAASQYDHIFTPRKAGIDDLRRLGCGDVSFLPFGYDPSLFFRPESVEAEPLVQVDDIFFAGGADADRAPLMLALVRAGFKLALYGDYWGKYRELRAHWRGIASVSEIRIATRKAKIALCLVRHANRDGNSMRTFEIPALGACCVMDDTEDHRALFGPDGACVEYFSSHTSLLEKCTTLRANATLRLSLASRLHSKIEVGHTYGDRLTTMLATCEHGTKGEFHFHPEA